MNGTLVQASLVRPAMVLSKRWKLFVNTHRCRWAGASIVTATTPMAGVYEEGDPTTFQVGTANYDVLRHRVRPDAVVTFPDRYTSTGYAAKYGKKSDGGHGDAEAHDGHPATSVDAYAAALGHGEIIRGNYDDSLDGQLQTMEYMTTAQAERLVQAMRDYHEEAYNLPRWRIPDLPAVHADFYGSDAMRNPVTWQNAPTQCNTCHQ